MLLFGLVLFLLSKSIGVNSSEVSEHLIEQGVSRLCELDFNGTLPDYECDEIGRKVAGLAVKLAGESGEGDEEWNDDEILEMVETLLVGADNPGERPINGTRHKRSLLSKAPKLAKKSWPVIKKFLKDIWSFLKNYLVMEGASGIQEKVEGMFIVAESLAFFMVIYQAPSEPRDSSHFLSLKAPLKLRSKPPFNLLQ